MKKSLFFIPLTLIGLGITSCSNEDHVNSPDNLGDITANYLNITLVQAPDMASRATETGDPGSATYEEGEGKENTVGTVRFYFFDDKNQPVVVSNNTNYINWNSKDAVEADGNNQMPNVEKQLKAIVLLRTKVGAELPTKIVAVLNPDETQLGTLSASLNTLRGYFDDYAKQVNAGDAFVMNNSVYMKGDEEMVATPIEKGNYASTAEEAKTKAVNIYVERNVAKVRVKFAETLGYDKDNNRIALKDAKDEFITAGGKPVYLELGAWNLTADTENTNLFKKIDTGWEYDKDGFVWNWEPYFRSYWTINASGEQRWHSFNDIAENGKTGFDGSLANSIYANENAPQKAMESEDIYSDTSIGDYTKVIIAGTLVDEEGNKLSIAKYASFTYLDENELKKAILGNISEGNKIYSYNEGDTDPSFQELKAEDVEFKTAMQSKKAEAGEENSGRYYVYLQLTTDAKNKKWTKSKAKESYQDESFADTDAVNKYLADNLGRAQIYDQGQTYYYFAIRHLGKKDKVGGYGVVRNHIYDCTISTLTGFGTPVYDPTEVIYPEKPEDDDTYIAAQINILSWRLVTDSVDLAW